MAAAEKFGVEPPEKKKTNVVDYGGPNVAKPLHVGHLRSAVIGESIKRINRYKGHRVIGDVHLGDWGLQMGLIITELKARKPELPYFDESFTGEYPQEAPFTVSELEEICKHLGFAHHYENRHPARAGGYRQTAVAGLPARRIYDLETRQADNAGKDDKGRH